MNEHVRRSRPQRAYDIVLFGATGFVGALTAEYLALHAPAGLRWALAGRDLGKLERLRERLAALDPACARLPLVRADAADTGALRELAASTAVLATTVGPYIWYGAELVAACAEEGTDYVDLTGEPEFVDRMYVAHDARARETGRAWCTPAGSTRSRPTWGRTSRCGSCPPVCPCGWTASSAPTRCSPAVRSPPP